MSAQNVFKSFFRERKQQIDRAQVYKIELIKFLKDNRRELMKQFENTNKELKRFADAPANNNDIAINLDNPKEEALRIDTLNYISNYSPFRVRINLRQSETNDIAIVIQSE